MGPEEQAVDNALIELYEDIEAQLQKLGNCNPTSEKHLVVRNETGIQELFSKVRAQLWDLELYAEEQDTVEETEAVSQCLQKHKGRYEQLRLSLHESKLRLQQAAEKVCQVAMFCQHQYQECY